MGKSKIIGEQRYDYIILEKLVKNKRSQYKIKCVICDNEKYTYNLNKDSMTHNEISCKETYCKSFINKIYGDFSVVNAYYKGRLLFDLKCNKCGETRFGVPQKDMNKLKNEHDIYCILNNDKYDKKLIHKICTTFQNCKTRIALGNEGDEKFKGYRGKEFGFDNSIELIQELYNNLEEMNKSYPLNELTIDRIDNNLGYIKGNVRFTTRKIQSINKSNSYLYFVDNKIFESSVDLAKYLNTYQQKISRLFGINDEFNYNGKLIKRENRYELEEYRKGVN